jgi:hypothetical protein
MTAGRLNQRTLVTLNLRINKLRNKASSDPKYVYTRSRTLGFYGYSLNVADFDLMLPYCDVRFSVSLATQYHLNLSCHLVYEGKE